MLVVLLYCCDLTRFSFYLPCTVKTCVIGNEEFLEGLDKALLQNKMSFLRILSVSRWIY